MGVILLASILIRVSAVAMAFRLSLQIRDWRILLFAGMLGLMAARQIITALRVPDIWSASLVGVLDEIPGLLVSVLAFVALLFLSRMIRAEREQKQNLWKSEQRFRDYAESASDWFWETDSEDRFTFLSANAALQRGTTRVPNAGHITGKTRADLRLPEDRDDAKWAAYEADIAARRPFRNFEYALIDNDGGKIVVRTSGKPIFGEDGAFLGYRGTCSDITERMRTEQTVALLQTAIENLSESVALFDPEDRFVFCNHAFRAVNRAVIATTRPGGTFEEFLRAVLRKGLVPEAKGREEAWLKDRLARHTRARGLFEVKRQDGRCFLVNEQRLANGNTISLGMDITERKRAQAVQRKQAREVHRLREELLHLARRRTMGEMASALTHELSQPLSAISNYLQAGLTVLEKDGVVVPAPVREYLDKAAEQSARAGAIIKNLRGFFQKDESDYKPEDVNRMVEQAGMLGLIDAGDRSITHDMHLGRDLPAVLASKVQIQQVVLNLIRNAMDAMVDTKRPILILETLARGDDAAEIVVRDTGPGVSAEITKRIFDPFVSTKENGMGMGLALCRAIVERHGGRIWVEPNVRNGSSFHFTLPLAPMTDSRA